MSGKRAGEGRAQGTKRPCETCAATWDQETGECIGLHGLSNVARKLHDAQRRRRQTARRSWGSRARGGVRQVIEQRMTWITNNVAASIVSERPFWGDAIQGQNPGWARSLGTVSGVSYSRANVRCIWMTTNGWRPGTNQTACVEIRTINSPRSLRLSAGCQAALSWSALNLLARSLLAGPRPP